MTLAVKRKEYNMDGNKKMALLGSAPIPKALLALGIPTMIGMLINALYNLVDTYFVEIGRAHV